MKHIRVAKRYALALFKSAKAENSLEEVKNDAELILSAIEHAKDFKAVLRSPVIQSWRKKNLLIELFKEKVSVLSMAFLEILCSKNREDITAEIYEQYYALYDEHFNIMRVSVSSAVALDESMRKAVEAGIEKRFGRKPIADYQIDASLKGGLRVQVGDTVLDSSLKTQLEKMHHSLLNDPQFLN